MSIELLPEWIRQNYAIEERYHACAILHTDFRAEWNDLVAALQEFRLTRTMATTRRRTWGPSREGWTEEFNQHGWGEHRFDIEVRVDGVPTLTPTHHVDYFRNRVAIETEWNNKDPFFDRDLTTFRLLFDLNVLSVGVVITRGDELQQIFNQLGRGESFGQNTTHMSQLIGRIRNRGSGGCPVLGFGIKNSLYVENE